MSASNIAAVDFLDTTTDLLESLTRAQRAVVAAFVQGVKVQESIAAAEGPAPAEAKN